MAKVKSLADYIAKWKAGQNAGGTAWLSGSQSTQKDPTALASAPEAISKAQQNYAAATAPGGRMITGLQRSGKAGWLAGIVAAGAAALSKGTAKGALKLAGPVGQTLFAAQQAASAAAAAAGSSSTARWTAAVNAMRAAFGKGSVT